jgi:hypothetical protein
MMQNPSLLHNGRNLTDPIGLREERRRSHSRRQVIDRMILLRLRFVLSQARRKNKDAPNLGRPNVATTARCQ